MEKKRPAVVLRSARHNYLGKELHLFLEADTTIRDQQNRGHTIMGMRIYICVELTTNHVVSS